MNKTILAHLALFMVSALYAGNFTIAKEVMPTYIQPFGFILCRVITGTLLFWMCHFLFVKETVERKDFGKLALCAVFGIAINQLCFFKGLNWTTPINASLIMLLTPIMVLIFAVFLGKERLVWNKIVGIILGGVGAATLISMGKQGIVGNYQQLGDLFVMINAISYAIYLVMVKSLLEKYHPLTVIKWVFTFGLLYVFPFGIQEFSAVEWQNIPTTVWYAIIYVLAGASFLTYLLNTVALREVSSSVASAYIYLQPVLATIIALSFGKDTLTSTKFFAGLLIFVGVFLVSWNRKPKVL